MDPAYASRFRVAMDHGSHSQNSRIPPPEQAHIRLRRPDRHRPKHAPGPHRTTGFAEPPAAPLGADSLAHHALNLAAVGSALRLAHDGADDRADRLALACPGSSRRRPGCRRSPAPRSPRARRSRRGLGPSPRPPRPARRPRRSSRRAPRFPRSPTSASPPPFHELGERAWAQRRPRRVARRRSAPRARS